MKSLNLPSVIKTKNQHTKTSTDNKNTVKSGSFDNARNPKTDKHKNELLVIGKNSISARSEPNSSQVSEPRTEEPPAHEKITEAWLPDDFDANYTLPDGTRKQEKHVPFTIPVPPVPPVSPMAKPIIPNPFDSKKIDLATSIKKLLQQPQSKLKDPELKFEINIEVAALNLELLKRNKFDLTKLCNK